MNRYHTKITPSHRNSGVTSQISRTAEFLALTRPHFASEASLLGIGVITFCRLDCTPHLSPEVRKDLKQTPWLDDLLAKWISVRTWGSRHINSVVVPAAKQSARQQTFSKHLHECANTSGAWQTLRIIPNQWTGDWMSTFNCCSQDFTAHKSFSQVKKWWSRDQLI